MIVTRRIALRIAVIVLLAVILQVSFFSYLQFFGAIPNLIPVVIVTLGLLGGGVVGAVCGFVAGLLLDSVLLQTLGVSSLVLLSVGYLAGRYR
jgi:rod shape-determining protein MreD